MDMNVSGHDKHQLALNTGCHGCRDRGCGVSGLGVALRVDPQRSPSNPAAGPAVQPSRMRSFASSSAFSPVTLGRVGSTLTLGHIRVTETFHAGGTRLRLHDHDDYTVNVVLEGLVEERVGRRTHECGPGTLLTKPGGQHHANRYLGDTVRCVVLQLGYGFGEPEWSWLQMERVRFRGDPEVVRVVRRLARALRTDTPDRALMVEREVWHLLALCADERRATVPARWVAEAGELLSAAEPVVGQLDDLASRLGVPPWVLCRAFERAYGLTPSQYRRRASLEHVARRLRETDAPVSAIAHAAGFADHSHLARWFRRAYRCTPTEYRTTSRARHRAGGCKAVLAPGARRTDVAGNQPVT